MKDTRLMNLVFVMKKAVKDKLLSLGYYNVKNAYIKITQDNAFMMCIYEDEGKLSYFVKSLKYCCSNAKTRACRRVRKDWLTLIDYEN